MRSSSRKTVTSCVDPAAVKTEGRLITHPSGIFRHILTAEGGANNLQLRTRGVQAAAPPGAAWPSDLKEGPQTTKGRHWDHWAGAPAGCGGSPARILAVLRLRGSNRGAARSLS